MRRAGGDSGAGKLYPALVVLWLLLTAVVTFAIVGTDMWASNAPLDTFAPKGESADAIQSLVVPVFVAAGVIFVLVEGFILLLAFRNRRGEDDDSIPSQTHGNVKLEIGWTIAPAAIVAFIAAATVLTIFELNDFSDTEMTVEVWGQQWWWEYRYDNDRDGRFGEPGEDIITANELVIPADTDVEMRISSNDVIHSFWIPNLNGKRDAVPGFATSWKVQADEPGRYRGQCTEFCGLSHGRMQMYVIALPPDEYAQWEENQLEDATQLTESDFESPEELAAWERGRGLIEEKGCTSCHSVQGVGGPEPRDDTVLLAGVAPDLTHFASRDHFAGAIFRTWLGVEDTVDEDTPVTHYLDKLYTGADSPQPDTAALEAWLRDPEAVKPMDPDGHRGMPNYNLSEQEIDDLVVFLSHLR